MGDKPDFAIALGLWVCAGLLFSPQRPPETMVQCPMVCLIMMFNLYCLVQRQPYAA